MCDIVVNGKRIEEKEGEMVEELKKRKEVTH